MPHAWRAMHRRVVPLPAPSGRQLELAIPRVDPAGAVEAAVGQAREDFEDHRMLEALGDGGGAGLVADEQAAAGEDPREVAEVFGPEVGHRSDGPAEVV